YSVLFEGAQATMLDIDHGTYPYITSSSTTAGGAATGTGVPPTRLHGVLGVSKAYTTRVGAGPFPSEMAGPLAEAVRARGHGAGARRPAAPRTRPTCRRRRGATSSAWRS